MVHVNGKKVGGNDAVTKFTAYVSPYFVVSNGGAYTKHIYAASQRIASKLGNEDGFGADPRRVEQAGGKKYSDIQKDNIGARYKELGFTYSAPEQEKVEKDSSMDSEAEEKLIFFYHSDHLGSTSYVTDADGNIAQHIEYIPYGEVFVEERNSQFSTNFLFNAKELDNETGLYYYGARYLDPTGAMWLSVDPMWEKYMGISPYAYCLGNPLKLVDPDGREGIVVSGSPGNHNNKTHFLENGLDRAMSAKNHVKKKGESVTWLIYNDSKKGFNEKDLNDYINKAKAAKINVKVVNKVKDIISYINKKDGDKAPRDKDKISSFYYVGHATPGDLDVGYQGSGEDFDPSDLNSEAFAIGCHVNVNGGCRTAVSDNYIIYEEKSVVEQFAEILDETSTIYGSDVRVYYPGGKVSDKDLLKKNNGNLVKRKGKKR
jgi:RHS repeat-associated protein